MANVKYPVCPAICVGACPVFTSRACVSTLSPASVALNPASGLCTFAAVLRSPVSRRTSPTGGVCRDPLRSSVVLPPGGGPPRSASGSVAVRTSNGRIRHSRVCSSAKCNSSRRRHVRWTCSMHGEKEQIRPPAMT